jgi:hypothetical protein
MRIRSIKPEFCRSRSLARVSIAAERLFATLWCYVDDDGIGLDDLRLLKADLYPLRDEVTTEEIDALLGDLVKVAGVVCRYEVNGDRLLHVINFREHQHPNRPTPSTWPKCTMMHLRAGHIQEAFTDDSMPAHGGLNEPVQKGAKTPPDLGFLPDEETTHGARNEDSPQERRGGESNKNTPSPVTGFGEFWSAYPKKVGKDAAVRAYERAARKVAPSVIAEGLHRALAWWDDNGTQRQYIPHPATWLNGGRWADEHSNDHERGESDPKWL